MNGLDSPAIRLLILTALIEKETISILVAPPGTIRKDTVGGAKY